MKDEDLPRCSVRKDGGSILKLVECPTCGSGRVEPTEPDGKLPRFHCIGCGHAFKYRRLLKNEMLLIDSHAWRAHMADPARRGRTISEEVGVRAILLEDTTD